MIKRPITVEAPGERWKHPALVEAPGFSPVKDITNKKRFSTGGTISIFKLKITNYPITNYLPLAALIAKSKIAA
jgi:hypothetical protein